MRVVWASLALSVVGFARAAFAADALPLHECLIEHPQKLAAIGARCATLPVAQDPSQPRGAMIGLSVAVVPALNRRAGLAPLFVLAGGPGQSAQDLYASLAGAFARANRSHDIVLVDQRGTGRSSPLACRYPEDWLEPAQLAAQLRAATLECRERVGARARFYTSSLAVQDLEQVRRALGYPRIDLYGASYGTRVAELYMRRFPEHTHAVVLDGVTYPEQAIGWDTPYDGERALHLILARCLASAECAAAFPDLERELDRLRARFGPEQVALTLSDPGTGAPLALVFGRGMLSAALRFLSYNSTEAALLPALIHEAAQGRLAPLAAQTVMMAREVGDQLSVGMQNTVVCSEDVPFFAAAPDRQKMAATYQGSEQLDALAQICGLWPRGPIDADLHAALRSAVPTLLLSGEADPVTPPEDAQRLARGLEHERHLVLAGEGHGQLATGCVPKLLAEFLDHPDPQALDARCLDGHRPAPFFVALAGPAP